MKFISTRGKSPAVTAAEVIRRGLAPDGGLYLAGFNLSEEEKSFPLPLAELGMENAAARDLWAHADLGKAAGETAIPAHGCFLWKLTTGE